MTKMQSVNKKQRSPWVAVAFLCLAVLILGIDDGVLNLALPTISEEFDASTSQLQWAVNAYYLSFGALLLTMGAIGDRFGRKRVFHIGLILFGISSLGAAASTSMGMLIAFRALMGIGGAVTLPQTLSIIRATFADPKTCAQAIAIWAGIFGLGYGIGPTVGGALLENFAWYSVFLINIPVVVIASAGGYYFLRDSRDNAATRLDIPGAALSIAGLFALIFGIIKAGEHGWTEGNVIIWTSAGVAVLLVFAWWESHTRYPLLPLRFFKNLSFSGATMAMGLAALATGALMFFLSQYLQSVQGYSAFESAVRLMPSPVLAFVIAVIAAPIAGAIGIKLTVSSGVLICGLGLFWLSFVEPGTSYPAILGGMSLVGAGYGLAWSPAANSVMASLPAGRGGIASAMDQTTQQLGGALGVAVLGTVMNGTYLDRMDNLKDVALLPEGAHETIRSSIQGAHLVAGQLPQDTSGLIISRSNDAFVSGMGEAVFIGSILLAVASVVTLIILPSRVRPVVE